MANDCDVVLIGICCCHGVPRRGVTRRNRIRNNYIKGTVKVVEVSKKIAVVWSCPAERGESCVQKGHGHGGGWEEDKGKAKIYRLKDSVSNGMQEMSKRA